MLVGHKVVYESGQIAQSSAHMGILSRTSGNYNFLYCNLDSTRPVDPYCQNKNLFNRSVGGHDPSKRARMAIYYRDSY
jgi:hypothetical protein